MATDLALSLARTIERELPVLRKLSDEQASIPRGPGKWCPKEELGHLIDSAANNHLRFVRGTLEPQMQGPGYAQDDWVRLHGYKKMPWEEIVELWFRYNRLLVGLIENIPEDRLTTVCLIGANPSVTLQFLMEDYVVHMQHHIDQLLHRGDSDANDDELRKFDAEGATPLPPSSEQGYLENDGAQIWYATYGSGYPVVLLHGGLGNSGNWGYQVPALTQSGYRTVVIDSRGHGRSTRDARPYSYDLMASDVLAVMDALHVERAALVGWSDGACTALILAAKAPSRAAGVFFFACNMDPSGVKPFEATPALNRCFSRHTKDYARLSATPDEFQEFAEAVGLMQRTQPNYSAQDLAGIKVPVAVVQGEEDEFIKREHAEYLAKTIPRAELIVLEEVSHFAPLQRPEQFNAAMLRFLTQGVLARDGVNEAGRASGG